MFTFRISNLILISRKKKNWWSWIVFVVWLTDERRSALFPAGTIDKDPHHRKSPKRQKQDLNLFRTWVQALLNEVVQ